jgi:hypothetical protein
MRIRSPHLVLTLVLAVLVTVACGRERTAEPTAFPSPTALPVAAAAEVPTQDTAVSAASAAAESPLAPESPLPTPRAASAKIEPKRAAVVGSAVHATTGAPIANAVIRLAVVYCPEDIKPEEEETKCIIALDDAFDPSTYSDESGFFEFLNIEPRTYGLLIGDIMGDNAYAVDANGDKIRYVVEADKVLDLGSVLVEYR